MDLFGQFWNFNIAINIDHVGITIIFGILFEHVEQRVNEKPSLRGGYGDRDKSAGWGGNGKRSPRDGAVMGCQLSHRVTLYYL